MKTKNLIYGVAIMFLIIGLVFASTYFMFVTEDIYPRATLILFNIFLYTVIILFIIGIFLPESITEKYIKISFGFAIPCLDIFLLFGFAIISILQEKWIALAVNAILIGLMTYNLWKRVKIQNG